ncbi:hypothetical protein [Rugamonas rubra]|uniref:Phasin family protein n=1 Tax=Rugamonas rubra TaxID=758825 RepID=A0A1I4NI62_9BURK|nr:hypothetical protein [Rugamonas rubra]SFM15151.1 hypothetical protein SAMN02982985_02987 [Rugamonas rubra]
MFAQALSPAVKAHCDVVINFHTDLARRALESLQAISEVNMRLTKEAMAELGEASQRMLATAKPAEQLASARGDVGGDVGGNALRNYQQGLADALARANHSLAQSAETHLPNVSRTANALADDMVRKANEEGAKAAERQRQTLDRMGLHGANGQGRPALSH